MIDSDKEGRDGVGEISVAILSTKSKSARRRREALTQHKSVSFLV